MDSAVTDIYVHNFPLECLGQIVLLQAQEQLDVFRWSNKKGGGER